GAGEDLVAQVRWPAHAEELGDAGDEPLPRGGPGRDVLGGEPDGVAAVLGAGRHGDEGERRVADVLDHIAGARAPEARARVVDGARAGHEEARRDQVAGDLRAEAGLELAAGAGGELPALERAEEGVHRHVTPAPAGRSRASAGGGGTHARRG